MIKPLFVGQLVRWHNTTANKWKCGLIVEIISLAKDTAYPKKVKVLWDTGELKAHGAWKLFPFGNEVIK